MTQATSPQIRKILLDSPSRHPALGFDRTAAALAELITRSTPRFAVGVFGEWGSGKTTLMEAIKHRLRKHGRIVTVEFNAWRFEREPQLLVPLLDSVRASIVNWSITRDAATVEQVRRTASRIGRVVRALAAGLSGSVGLPGAVSVSYDLGVALDMLSDRSDQAQSLYVAAFNELSDAFHQLRTNGVDRVVVFVDDLDRCLPANALDVLESMKLFFDMYGFVFVVGLDRKVVQRAVRSRFQDLPMPLTQPPSQIDTTATQELERLERDYIEKIFQVPYHVPQMLADDLDSLLRSMYDEAELEAPQLADFKQLVRPYLGFIAIERRVNPREVKRFLNAYTVQTSVRSDLEPEVVLALQTLTFRYDWQNMYDAILTDSILFVDALKRYRSNDESAFEDLTPELGILQPDLADYLRSPCLNSLCQQSSLDRYLSSLESTAGTPRELATAYQELGRLRSELRKVRATANPDEPQGEQLVSVTRAVISLLDSMKLDPSSRDQDAFQALLQQVNALSQNLHATLRVPSDRTAANRGSDIRVTADQMYELTNRIYRELRSWQRNTRS